MDAASRTAERRIMMAEYIEREALQNLFNDVSTSLLSRGELAKDAEHMVRAFLMVTEMIQDAPAADVAPVQHGRWIEKTAPAVHKYYECSKCGAHENKHTAIKGRYCWRCGAKMDGAE